MIIQGQVGPTSTQSAQPGATPPLRLGQLGDAVVSELHGRFYEQTYRGNFFRYGTTASTICLSTHGTTTGTSTTLATAQSGTPMLGLWNPMTSSVNAVLTQATLAGFPSSNAGQPLSSLVWCISLGNGTPLTNGAVPFNSKTLQQTGSQCRAWNGATTAAGLTNYPVVFEAADFATGGYITYSSLSAAGTMPSYVATQNFDGQLFIPPGGFLALYNTANSTTWYYSGRLLWEEVPL
jgi:hypothetical protein